jgi:hypothetical protein
MDLDTGLGRLRIRYYRRPNVNVVAERDQALGDPPRIVRDSAPLRRILAADDVPRCQRMNPMPWYAITRRADGQRRVRSTGLVDR